MGKKTVKPPKVVNYQQAQKEQAAADTETTQAQSQLNNPNQVNPFGTQTTTYDETGTPTVTQALTPDSQSALTAQQQTQKMLAESGAAAAKRYQDMISQPFNPNLAGIQTSFNQGGNIMSDPNQMGGFSSKYKSPYEEEREPEMTADPAQTRANSDAWRERIKQRRLAGQQPGGGVFDKSASGDFTGQQAMTNLDLSNVAKMPVNAGMTGQQAIMARLDPQLQRMDEQARQRLANQGLTYGGEAYNRAMGDVNQGRNDLLSQAALQGINLDMSANQQGYNQALSSGGFYNQGVGQNYGQGMGTQEARNAAIGQNQNSALARQQAMNQSQQQKFSQDLARAQFGNTAQDQSLNQQLQLRQQPLNEVMGLMGGSQIQLPQFQGYQAATKSPQEILLAQQMQDKALMDRYGIESANANASNAATAGLIGSVAGLAAAPMTGGTSLAGSAFSKMLAPQPYTPQPYTPTPTMRRT